MQKCAKSAWQPRVKKGINQNSLAGNGRWCSLLNQAIFGNFLKILVLYSAIFSDLIGSYPVVRHIFCRSTGFLELLGIFYQVVQQNPSCSNFRTTVVFGKDYYTQWRLRGYRNCNVRSFSFPLFSLYIIRSLQS